jgi:hypothetical protein
LAKKKERRKNLMLEEILAYKKKGRKCNVGGDIRGEVIRCHRLDLLKRI